MISDFIVDGRREFFGSVFYHTEKRLYYGFDVPSTEILLLLQKSLSKTKLLKQNEIKDFFEFFTKKQVS